MAFESKETITTAEILEELRNSKNKDFFYLHVSISRIEVAVSNKDEQQQQITKFFPIQDEDDDTTDDDDDSGAMSQPSASAQLSPSQSRKKVRKEVRKQIHDHHLPLLLRSNGWMKVVDKNGKPIHKTLFFNIFEKSQDENDVDHIQKVSKIPQRIAEEMKIVKRKRYMKHYNVNFKTNSFLSTPLLYDSLSLEETNYFTITQERVYIIVHIASHQC